MVQVKYDYDARKELLSGVNFIAKAVKTTLGPSGKNVLIRRSGETAPRATKDGVTVAGALKSDNIFEQQAIELMQEIANQADADAGDGTSTATVLAEALFERAIKEIDKYNVVDYNQGIKNAVRDLIELLKERAVIIKDNLEELKKVAMIASNNDETISKVVVDAFEIAGDQGVVNIKRSRYPKTYLSTIDGVNLPTGYRSIYYINDHKTGNVDFKDAYLYMTNERITAVTDNLNELLIHVSKEQKPLLILCSDIDQIVSDVLINAVREGSLQVCVCKAPEFGTEQIEMFRDLGIIFGKEPFLENELDFNSIPKEAIMDFIPQVEGVIATKDRLSIKGPIVDDEKYKEIEIAKKNKADQLREQVKNEHTNSFDKGKIQTRISRLTHGIAYINIYALSEIEYDEKQHRITDALYSVKSANEEGIIPGGGFPLAYLSKMMFSYDKNESRSAGYQALKESLNAPMIQIAKNVGVDLKNKNYDWDKGYDSRNKIDCDLISNGIIDAVKVTRAAVENASNIIGMLLTTDCVIVEDSVYQSNNYKYGIE